MGVTSDSSGDAKSARGTYSAPSSRSGDFLSLGDGGRCPSRTARNLLRESTSRKHCPCFFNIIHASHTQPPYSHDTLTHMLTTRTDHTVHAPHADRMADPAVRSPCPAGVGCVDAQAETPSGESAISPGSLCPLRARTTASRRAEILHTSTLR